MKILLVTSFFPPTHTAGTEKRTFGYAKTLLERSHQVQVLCAGDWDTGDHGWNGVSDELYEGVPIRRVHLNWQKSADPNLYLYRNPMVCKNLLEWLPRWRPDVVHITSCLTLSASVIEAAKAQNLPVVLTLTDFWFLCPKLSLLRYDGALCDSMVKSQECIRCLSWDSELHQRLRRTLSDPVAVGLLHYASKITPLSRRRGLRGMALNISQRRFYLNAMLNLADVVTAPSQHLRQAFVKTGITQVIEVIQSGHDLSWLENAPPKRVSERVRFGYIGQLIPAKGVDVLLRAFGGRDWQGKAELHLYGNSNADPFYWQTLQQIENRNAAQTFFHGPFPHAQLGEVLAGLDVLIVPSVWSENNPRVIQEAFAGQTPVIASDVGGIAEYVRHEGNGLLFRRGDAADLQAQMARLVQNPAEIEQFGAHLPAVRSMAAEMDDFEAIYQALAK